MSELIEAAPGRTAYEIIQAYADERARLAAAMFDVPIVAAQLDWALSAEEVNNSPNASGRDQKLNKSYQWATEVKDDLRHRYLQTYLEESEALAQRQIELEEFLDADQTDQAAIFTAVSSSEQELIAAAKIALSIGESGKDCALVALQAARELEYSRAVEAISSLIPEWAGAVAEIADIQDRPTVDEDRIKSEFDQVTPDVNRESILNARPSGHDVSAILQSYMT